MRTGELVAERFEILREAGAGGMSTVYLARDRTSGAQVALKMLDGRGDLASRFAREARALAELSHPGVVGYVAHGLTAAGQRYLAMEWLEGEDLSQRLERAGLTVEESLVLLRAVADAVGFAHGRGIVHRDLKPSNLFLPGGAVERVKLLDFGVVRLSDGEAELTRTGARVGTPAYMSPEQARGEPNPGPTVDVFALGCVLYQCLTGRKPFVADDPLALIAKILLADPPPPSELRPEVPPELDQLVSRMLAKDATLRPPDGAALASELEPLIELVRARAPVDRASAAPTLTLPSALTQNERRLLCVILVRGVRSPSTVEALREQAGSFGARLERLTDGTLIVTLQPPTGATGAATDLAGDAAQLALSLRRIAPGAKLALVTGRAVVPSGGLPFARGASGPVDSRGRLAVGEAIDRAAKLLRLEFDDEATQLAELPNGDSATSAPLAIRIDDVTAGLLDPRFDLGGDGAGALQLRGLRELPDGTRRLLGQPTPCVGREAELASIEALYAHASADDEARAVLVTAPAGVGKSRLRYELAKRLEAREPTPMLLVGRGDPLRAGAPFGLLADAVRRAAGVRDDDAPALKQAKLRARLSRHLPPDQLPRVSEFIGELAGVPFPHEGSLPLEAARADAMLMGDQVRRAFADWLEAECAAQPVVLILEDLHWGDRPTVHLVDEVLRRLRDRPLLVLALARPEVHELFPHLWQERAVQEVRLHELSMKAATKLVKKVLPQLTDEDVTRLCERAGGNAFYLEELIRARAEGRHELPETVLAMTQARLESMEPDARQVLRAASVYGEVFWAGAITALLGEKTVDVDGWLEALCKREVITRRGEGRFRGEAEFVFRHALVREAAYAMLTDHDRRVGHRLAAEWLELAGESEAIVLAEHCERGAELERAASFYRRAAEQALAANDFAATCERARHGMRCGATGDALGALYLLDAEARGWRAEWATALDGAREALKWLPPGSDGWYAAAGEAGWAAGVLGDRERHAEVAALLEARASSTIGDAELTALTRVAMQALYLGQSELAERLYDWLDRVTPTVADRPAQAARLLSAQSSRALFLGNPGTFLERVRGAADAFAQTGDLRSVCMKQGSAGYALLEIGDYANAVETLRQVLQRAERMGLQNTAATAKQNLGLALGRLGHYDEARAVESAAMEAFRATRNRRMEAASRYYLALILGLAGELEQAEREARAAVAQASEAPPLPPVVAEGTAILAQILLARGRHDEARAAAAEAMRLLDEMGGIDGGESTIRLVWAESLKACGEGEAARRAITVARDKLRAAAEKITDPAVRQMFLERVPENARTLALAGDWTEL